MQSGEQRGRRGRRSYCHAGLYCPFDWRALDRGHAADALQGPQLPSPPPQFQPSTSACACAADDRCWPWCQVVARGTWRTCWDWRSAPYCWQQGEGRWPYLHQDGGQVARQPTVHGHRAQAASPAGYTAGPSPHALHLVEQAARWIAGVLGAAVEVPASSSVSLQGPARAMQVHSPATCPHWASCCSAAVLLGGGRSTAAPHPLGRPRSCRVDASGSVLKSLHRQQSAAIEWLSCHTSTNDQLLLLARYPQRAESQCARFRDDPAREQHRAGHDAPLVHEKALADQSRAAVLPQRSEPSMQCAQSALPIGSLYSACVLDVYLSLRWAQHREEYACSSPRGHA